MTAQDYPVSFPYGATGAPYMGKWKRIREANSLYSVSSLGQIRRGEAILGGSFDSKRYRVYALYISPNQRIMRKGHRLVAQAFIPNPKNLPQVNHRNGIKTDNRVENLEWCTNKENNSHALITGLVNTRGENSGKNKYKEQIIRLAHETKNSANHVEFAKQHGLTSKYVSAVRLGRRWHWLWEEYNA